MIAQHTGWLLIGLCLALAMSSDLGGSFAFAQEEHGTSTGDLAKAAQNPIADMISVPFQSNRRRLGEKRNEHDYRPA